MELSVEKEFFLYQHQTIYYVVLHVTGGPHHFLELENFRQNFISTRAHFHKKKLIQTLIFINCDFNNRIYDEKLGDNLLKFNQKQETFFKILRTISCSYANIHS